MENQIEQVERYQPSETLLDIYRMFNVNDQRERMRQLSKKDLYFLLLCCIDNHDEEQPNVVTNYSEFEPEIDDILELQESEKTTNPILLELVKETGSSWIEVGSSFVKEEKDNTLGMSRTVSNVWTPVELPKPYTIDEIRELKLNNLLDN